MFSDPIFTIIFKCATGISAEQPLREKILDIYNKSNGDISMSHMRGAARFMELIDGHLKIEITKMHVAEAWFNRTQGSLFVVLALLSLIFPSVINDPSIYQFLVFTAMGGFLLMFSLFIFAQTFPIFSARKVKSIIEKLQENEIK